MNEKWFAYAISLSIMLIFINSFVTMGAGLVDANGNGIGLLQSSTNNQYSYDTLKSSSNYGINVPANDSSQSPTSEQGYTPITSATDTSKSKALDSIGIIVNLGVGFELLMGKLATIFPPVAPLFWSVAGFAFFIKLVALTWLASIVVRQLFFGRVF
ncbi:MAG TPA: hypothetical protein PKN54_05760 [Candidatus Cloacimonas acidaminovorans]|nr:hypothetical protein [Candidatus Cloacimonas acidaminovorans]